jgi:hypothetical protein
VAEVVVQEVALAAAPEEVREEVEPVAVREELAGAQAVAAAPRR